jgi:hypothetical protein
MTTSDYITTVQAPLLFLRPTCAQPVLCQLRLDFPETQLGRCKKSTPAYPATLNKLYGRYLPSLVNSLKTQVQFATTVKRLEYMPPLMALHRYGDVIKERNIHCTSGHATPYFTSYTKNGQRGRSGTSDVTNIFASTWYCNRGHVDSSSCAFGLARAGLASHHIGSQTNRAHRPQLGRPTSMANWRPPTPTYSAWDANRSNCYVDPGSQAAPKGHVGAHGEVYRYSDSRRRYIAPDNRQLTHNRARGLFALATYQAVQSGANPAGPSVFRGREK